MTRAPGRLYGVGLGPGDAELMTVRASRLIGSADVVAYHCARHGRSVARSIAAEYLHDGQIEEVLAYPVTTEVADHPGGYQGAIDDFYTDAAARLAAHLDAGRDVAVLCEGDPFFFGSYMHMHKRLAHRYHAEVIPGITSMSAAAAELGTPLVERDEVLTVLPGTLSTEELARRLADTDSAAILKLGRTFGEVRAALETSGRLKEAWYVERASTDRQHVLPLADVDPDVVPYFSVAIVPSPSAAASALDPALAAPVAAQIEPVTGSVAVVGLGPAGREWTTPQVQGVLAEADDLIGYKPYLDRIAANSRQRRHASDNKVEAERAQFALDLAARGSRVVVVSSGDPGVFAMAAAVLEEAIDERYAEVDVQVYPGLTAAQAVASRVGAPLGHDFCVLSLSDRLKPWEAIERRLRAAAEGDFVLAIYNPASRSRTWQVGAARDLLLEHRAPETPVVIGRDVGGREESIKVVTLATLDPSDVDMRCLLLIGSSTTRVVEKPGGTPVVFTPRRYPI